MNRPQYIWCTLDTSSLQIALQLKMLGVKVASWWTMAVFNYLFLFLFWNQKHQKKIMNSEPSYNVALHNPHSTTLSSRIKCNVAAHLLGYSGSSWLKIRANFVKCCVLQWILHIWRKHTCQQSCKSCRYKCFLHQELHNSCLVSNSIQELSLYKTPLTVPIKLTGV